MDPLPATTRRANLWLFTALVVFALALAVVCFLWMRVVVRNNGGVVDPQPHRTSLRHEPVIYTDFALRTILPCLT